MWNREALRKSFLEHFIHLKKVTFNHPTTTAKANKRIRIGFQKQKLILHMGCWLLFLFL